MVEFNDIIADILQDKEFQKLALIKHHKGSRLEHSLKVAKQAYQIADKLNLDKRAVARAGLLHDFFYEDYIDGTRINLACNHGKIAYQNAMKFGLNKKEENIIKSHMFPLGGVIPKSKEAWLITLIDKVSAITEKSVNYKCRHAVTLASLMLCLRSLL